MMFADGLWRTVGGDFARHSVAVAGKAHGGALAAVRVLASAAAGASLRNRAEAGVASAVEGAEQTPTAVAWRKAAVEAAFLGVASYYGTENSKAGGVMVHSSYLALVQPSWTVGETKRM